MKTRESGMPDEGMWSSFFSPAQTLEKLGLTRACGDVVDFGCGFGTFSIPAAQIVRGTVHALDIEREMVEETARKAKQAGVRNVRAVVRDFVAEGTGLADGSADYVMLFNILHCEGPMVLLREAWRVLREGRVLGMMHWNYDAATPRGPSMEIRPRPEHCVEWAREAGFELDGGERIELPPWHWGVVMRKVAARPTTAGRHGG